MRGRFFLPHTLPNGVFFATMMTSPQDPPFPFPFYFYGNAAYTGISRGKVYIYALLAQNQLESSVSAQIRCIHRFFAFKTLETGIWREKPLKSAIS